MIKDKRALSTVVTTLIILLLVLVAVGIVWVVFTDVTNDTSDQVKSKAACLGVQVELKEITCTGASACTATVERLSGGGNIEGVKVTISEGTNSLSGQSSGGMNVLDVSQVTIGTGDGLTDGAMATVKAAAILSDGTVCDIITEGTITIDLDGGTTIPTFS